MIAITRVCIESVDDFIYPGHDSRMVIVKLHVIGVEFKCKVKMIRSNTENATTPMQSKSDNFTAPISFNHYIYLL